MKPSLIDRLKNAYFTNRVNVYARLMEAPMMSKAQHDQQRDRVRASEARSGDKTEAHATYARRPLIRHIGGGWKTGQVTPPRTTGR